jgi:predicted alpha/beta hydrolase family esterase
MKIILLSGQSLQNKEWIERVRSKFLEKYSDVDIMYYSHWDKGESIADVDLETEKFINLINTLNQDYILFAKSIGTVVFLNSLSKLKKQPQKVIMVGVPYILAKEKGYDFDTLKDKVKSEVAIFQKENDPMASYEDVKKAEGNRVKVNMYICNGEENDNHSYENLSYLLELIGE